MTRDEIQAELNAEYRARDSLAQFLGYWMLQDENDVYRGVSKLRYMRTSPPTREDAIAAESKVDNLCHQWNRTRSAYRARTKRIDELRSALKKE